MRQIERWLHQHIFKVGWLLSHNYETTTILYYTVFLPGVFLHEVIYWLMAGVMNVRAERAIQWPEKQEIGNLQLNFIKLTPKAHPLKRAVISATPLIAGLLAIWAIGVNIFQLEIVMSIASTGQLEDVAQAFNFLVSAPDFWLWFYISFTIANTMFPTIPKDMRGWWQIGGAAAIIIITLLILGIGQNLLSNISLSIVQILNSLSLTLLLTIGINFTMVMILGLIEYLVERVTGHSATFQKGKMITMTREEALQRKREEQEKRLAARSASPRRVASADPVSVYTFEFPIPGPPGQEPITKGVAAILGMDDSGELPSEVEEDEIVETTAPDSARQRMLRLFPENKSTEGADTKGDSTEAVATNQPALPSGESARIRSQAKRDITDAESNKKPELGVKAFGQSDTEAKPQLRKPSNPPISASTSETEKPAIPKPLSVRQPIRPSIETADDSDAEKPLEKPKATSIPKPIIGSPLAKPDDKQVDETSQAKPDEERPKVVASRESEDFSIRKPVVDDTETDSDDEKSDSQVVSKAIDEEQSDKPDDKTTDEKKEIRKPQPTSSISKAKPVTSSKADDVEDDEDEQLKTRLPRRTSIFDDLVKPSDTTDNDQRESEKKEVVSPFSRPFVKRDDPMFDDDGEDDDTDEESEDSPFARPFAPNTTKSTDNAPRATPTWQTQLSNTSLSGDSEDEDEDDEQLSTRLPRRQSIFDSLNTDKAEDKPKSTSSNWRSQIGNTSRSGDSEDEDEDDEQLSTRLPRRESIFDSLNTDKAGDKPKSTSSNWRSQIGNTSRSGDSENEDEDDEQLSTRLPRRQSIFDSLNTDKAEDTKTTSSWRAKLPNTSSTEDDDEEATSNSKSILSGLGRPQSNTPRSTIKGKGSRPAPKPTEKPTASDWRSQIKSDLNNDENDEDEELHDVRYEPIEDDIIYEDDDEYGYVEDEGEDYFDDDF